MNIREEMIDAGWMKSGDLWVSPKGYVMSFSQAMSEYLRLTRKGKRAS